MVSLKTVTLVSLATLTQSVMGHFSILVPGSRGSNHDTQTEGPCGGKTEVVLPRIDFNPKGTPIGLKNGHTQVYGEINLCLSDNCTTQDNFNITIWNEWEQLGAGNYCIPDVTLPSGLAEGTNGTIQVVYLADDGYLYNCVDVTLSNEGITESSLCTNSTGVTAKFDTSESFSAESSASASASGSASASSNSQASSSAASNSSSSSSKSSGIAGAVNANTGSVLLAGVLGALSLFL